MSSSLSQKEEDALEMMKEDQLGITEQDKQEIALASNWDPEKNQNVMKHGIFTEESIEEVSMAQRSKMEALRISHETGLEYEEALQLIKNFVFKMKKLEEENLRRENQKMRKEKRKEFKRLMHKIGQDPFDPFTDWEAAEKTPEDKKIEEIFEKSQVLTQMDDNIKEVLDEYVRLTTRKERGELDGEELYEVQQSTNMTKFLNDFFLHKQNKVAHCTGDKEIRIEEILPHSHSRTTFLFWTFVQRELNSVIDKTNEQKKEMEEQINLINQKLNRFSTYLGRVALKQMGGKKPPKFVFLKSRKLEFTEESRDNFKAEFPALIREELLKNRKAFVTAMRTPEEIDSYIEKTLDSYLEMSMLQYGQLYSNHIVLSKVKKTYGSIENYVQRILQKKKLDIVASTEKEGNSAKDRKRRKNERKLQRKIADFNSLYYGH
jgi:hypothetical protein